MRSMPLPSGGKVVRTGAPPSIASRSVRTLRRYSREDGADMTVLQFDIPTWVLDWSGSLMVVVSLVFLFQKRTGYWHWSNASLVPYFALFVSLREYMLAGLQASYLVFGIHGLMLWK